jgi:hypothetical protein
MFPVLQQDASLLREHPRFGRQWDTLQKQLTGAVPIRSVGDKEALVLSLDVLAAPSDQVKQLVTDVMSRGGLVVLLGSEASAEKQIEALGVDEELFCYLRLDRAGEESAYHALPEGYVVADAVSDLISLLMNEGVVRVLSHGLDAHACAMSATREADLVWYMVGGADFGALLGALPQTELLSIERLYEAMAECDRALFLGETAPHSMGRISQRYLRALEGWRRIRLSPVVSRGALTLESGTVLGIATQMSDEEWLALAKKLSKERPELRRDPMVQIVAWDQHLERLRALIVGEENINVIEAYGVSTHIYNSAKR